MNEQNGAGSAHPQPLSDQERILLGEYSKTLRRFPHVWQLIPARYRSHLERPRSGADYFKKIKDHGTEQTEQDQIFGI